MSGSAIPGTECGSLPEPLTPGPLWSSKSVSSVNTAVTCSLSWPREVHSAHYEAYAQMAYLPQAHCLAQAYCPGQVCQLGVCLIRQ